MTPAAGEKDSNVIDVCGSVESRCLVLVRTVPDRMAPLAPQGEIAKPINRIELVFDDGPVIAGVLKKLENALHEAQLMSLLDEHLDPPAKSQPHDYAFSALARKRKRRVLVNGAWRDRGSVLDLSAAQARPRGVVNPLGTSRNGIALTSSTHVPWAPRIADFWLVSRAIVRAGCRPRKSLGGRCDPVRVSRTCRPISSSTTALFMPDNLQPADTKVDYIFRHLFSLWILQPCRKICERLIQTVGDNNSGRGSRGGSPVGRTGFHSC